MNNPAYQRLIKEKDFISTVVQMARALGWMVYHPWISIHSTAGFPDLVMVRNGRLCFAELKTEIGKLTETQHQWLMALHECDERGGNVEVYLWRPSDLDEIEKILA